MNLNLWNYIMIGNLVFNAGIFIGGLLSYRKLVNNDLKHLRDGQKEIKEEIKSIKIRCEDHVDRLGRLEEKTSDMR